MLIFHNNFWMLQNWKIPLFVTSKVTHEPHTATASQMSLLPSYLVVSRPGSVLMAATNGVEASNSKQGVFFAELKLVQAMARGGKGGAGCGWNVGQWASQFVLCQCLYTACTACWLARPDQNCFYDRKISEGQKYLSFFLPCAGFENKRISIFDACPPPNRSPIL